jgi:hypothetical protein
MKRDMDLIRAILLKVESDGKIGIPGDHTDEEIADHVQQMREEGLVEGEVIKNREGIPCHAVITRLTSKGHEFLNSISKGATPSREVNDAAPHMTDAQLRDKILKWFYEHRSEGDCHVDPSRFSDIPAGEIPRICGQLKGQGLIEWKTPGGALVDIGVGRITARGSDRIEHSIISTQPQQGTVSESTYSYCYECGGDRSHEILGSHNEQQSFPDPPCGEMVTFGEISQLLKCKGCGFVSMRKAKWSSEMDQDDHPVWRYFPPQHSKPLPSWLKEIQDRDKLTLVLRCFIECYEAFSAGAVWIACVGARSVLEQIMIEKVSDQGSFAKNLKGFKDAEHISGQDENRLKILVEAGHASTHRSFDPKKEEVSAILDVLSNLLESLYFDENKLTALRDRIPPRES